MVLNRSFGRQSHRSARGTANGHSPPLSPSWSFQARMSRLPRLTLSPMMGRHTHEVEHVVMVSRNPWVMRQLGYETVGKSIGLRCAPERANVTQRVGATCEGVSASAVWIRHIPPSHRARRRGDCARKRSAPTSARRHPSQHSRLL